MNYICFDVGGTIIKAGIIRDSVLGKIYSYDAKSNESKEIILENFKAIIDTLIQKLDVVDCLAFAFPGNFDYENGISLIKGVKKYDSIYEFNLKEYFTDYIVSSYKDKISDNFSCKFINDVSAVMLGSIKLHEKAKKGKAVTLCIGTGCGSAFMINGKIVTEGNGIPENGWVYPMPLLSETYDDILSVRGFKKLALKITGSAIDGLEASKLYENSKDNSVYKKLFDTFGCNIRAGLEKIISDFNPNTIILGGGIMKSYSLFGKTIEAAAKKYGINIIIAADTTRYALLGLI